MAAVLCIPPVPAPAREEIGSFALELSALSQSWGRAELPDLAVSSQNNLYAGSSSLSSSCRMSYSKSLRVCLYLEPFSFKLLKIWDIFFSCRTEVRFGQNLSCVDFFSHISVAVSRGALEDGVPES